jgi:hypothetical protein
LVSGVGLKCAGIIQRSWNKFNIGFRKAQQFEKLSAFGRIQIETSLKDNNDYQVIQLYSDQIEEGMSGAAVLDLEINRVIGIVSLHHPAKGSNVDTRLKFAIPVGSVLQSSKAAPILKEKNPGLRKNNLLDRVTTGDVRLIKNKEEIESYYNVLPDRIVKVRESNKEEISKWIDEWDWLNGRGKPILLLTGDPGMGKSWLACVVARELMEKGYIIMKITGADVQETLFRDTDADGLKPQDKYVFVLDDRGISIEEVDAPVNPDDIYKILKSMTDTEQSFHGPVILSIREETWNFIISGTREKKRFDEFSINRLVERKELYPLNYQQSKKIVESFYSVVDQNNPPYKNLVVNDAVKSSIIEKSKGNTVIIRLFFEHMNFKSTGNTYTICLLDTEEIISSARYYCLKQVFSFYLNEMEVEKEEEEKIAEILAFLYFICKRGMISIGYLKCMGVEDHVSLPVEIIKHIDLSNYRRSLPLFNIDDYGIISAFHNSANEAITNLVEKPGRLRKNLEEELNDKSLSKQQEYNSWQSLLGKISRISDINFTTRIKEKSSRQFMVGFNEAIKNYTDYYLRKWNYEIENDDFISSESTYYLLSLFLDITEVSWKEFEKIFPDGLKKFGELLMKNKIE